MQNEHLHSSIEQTKTIPYSCDACAAIWLYLKFQEEIFLKRQLLTFTAEPDSSKLERKPWARNGLKCSEPVASRLHASQSYDETSEIEEITETDIFLAFSGLVGSP